MRVSHGVLADQHDAYIGNDPVEGGPPSDFLRGMGEYMGDDDEDEEVHDMV